LKPVHFGRRARNDITKLDEPKLRARNTADVSREQAAKRAREAEAEAWIAEVRARKAKRP
jgi:hypothetical protein